VALTAKIADAMSVSVRIAVRIPRPLGPRLRAMITPATKLTPSMTAVAA
jgi:hypothetical protein